MPFLRFTRDKRGYEHFQLVQPTTNRRGQTKTCVLYWFRSPPNVRVGREPFDQHVRAALEQQNPDLEFDWDQILATPIPSGDAERWRERRKQERVARQAAAEEDESNDSIDSEAQLAAPIINTPASAGVVASREDGGRNRRGRHGPHRPTAIVIDTTPQELTAESSGPDSPQESKPEFTDDDL